jgi:hypothetical protein
MKNSLRVLSLLLCALPLVARAAGEEPKKHHKESLHDQFTGQGYGVSGCGLGSIVFGPKPGMIQVIAATLNGTAGSQTFGISSGTSNCDIPTMGHEAAMFIETNKEAFRKEAARGQGETINGLAVILNCQDAASFGAKLQQNYPSVMKEGTSTYEQTRRILDMIKSDSHLTQTCAKLS